jgi:UDP-3-O-[3-hydroxymyristoyl] glucosamine N-acyltransferase
MKNVYGSAIISGNARIFDNAVISGNAHIFDNAIISGNAIIMGNAVIYGNAIICGNAIIYNDAIISGNARISGNADIRETSDYLVVGPAKSSEQFTTAHKDSVIGIRINCGCFSGTVNEFEVAIKETHKNNTKARNQYLAFVALIKANFDLV